MQYTTKDGNIGELKFYGYISEWWISGEDFTRTLEEMAGKFKAIHIRTHCYGGSVFEGNVMVNAISRCPIPVIVYIDGVSASMMTIVMMACDEIVIADNGFVMVHCPIGYQEGNAKQMASTMRLLTAMEKNFAKAYAKKTGKSEKDVAAWFDGADHWFSAEEAKAEGLVTRIETSVVKGVPNMGKPTENDQQEAVFGRFAALLTDPINEDKSIKNNLNMKKELIAKFGLTGVTENSTDAEITAALEAHFKNGNQTETIRSQAVEAIIAGMENATGKKYEEKLRASLVTVGNTSGFDVLQAMLGINTPNVETQAATPQASAQTAQAVPQVLTMLNTGGANASADGRKDWSWDKWQAEDPDGLEAKAKTEPETFKALHKAKFGFDPF